MKRQAKFKIPNALICDAALPLSARKVGAVLFAYCDAHGQVCKGLREIAQLSRCTPQTAQRAVAALADAGYIEVRKRTRYDAQRRQLVHDRNCYVLRLDFSAGYTLAPYALFRYELTPAAYMVSLYIIKSAGASRRAYPSLSRIMDALGVARSTVCAALAVLRELPLFLVQLCRKANGALSCSSYWIVTILHRSTSSHTAHTEETVSAVLPGIRFAVPAFIVRLRRILHNPFSLQGVVRFLPHQVRNKITEDLSERKKSWVKSILLRS